MCSVKRGINRWRRPVYRAFTGFKHDLNTTAADVVRYETADLDNDIGVDPVLIPYLKTVPASRVVWVTRTPEEAQRYGDVVEDVELGAGAWTIGKDGEGGYLILLMSLEDKSPICAGSRQGRPQSYVRH